MSPFQYREPGRLIKERRGHELTLAVPLPAIGLFCPDCGAANLHLHFARETALVAQQIEVAQAIESELGSELSYESREAAPDRAQPRACR